MNPHMLPKVRSRTLLRAVATYPCTARVAALVPGLRCAPRETVVPAHLPVAGKGVGTKVSDLAVIAACHTCHDLIDRRDSRWQQIPRDQLYMRLLRALCETQALLVRDGIVAVAGQSVT